MPVIRACGQCGAKNRLAVSRLAETAQCGACKQPIAALHEPLAVDEALFDEIVRGATVPVLVDFWAAWCGPCRMVAPEVAKTAAQMAGAAVVLKVDTEANPGLSARYAIRSIPMLMVFRGGKVVQQQAGAVGSAQMLGWLRAAGA